MSYKIEIAEKKDFPEIVEVWEASVRATHDFLTEEDIQYFKPLILNEYLKMVDLSLVRDESKQIVGFSGIVDKKIEMLFIQPSWRGKGIGKTLVDDALDRQKVTEVEVNEQNEQAIVFYKHVGFKVTGRSEVDSLGKPYPLLHMALRSK